jgi:hypothetical protein
MAGSIQSDRTKGLRSGFSKIALAVVLPAVLAGARRKHCRPPAVDGVGE